MATAPLRTKLYWDFGTAYDLFLSLHVLHEPDIFGLKASWAAGVRSRIPSEHRQTLELMRNIMSMPHYFVHNLPQPKSAETLLDALMKMPTGMRLPALYFRGNSPKELREILHNCSARAKWTRAEKNVIVESFRMNNHEAHQTVLEQLHYAWSHREEYGEALLAALKSYFDNFFAEEEQRILPVLKQGLSHAQMRSGSLPLAAMLEELSSGVRYRDLEQINSIHLAPSFWGAPLLFYDELDNDEMLMLFPARPETMAIIPGEIVPDALLNGLKALSDSTRLRILRYLTHCPQTAAQLSRALRLRPPTVAHHLMGLRMAGVVQVIISHEGDRQYATRFEGFDTIQDLLYHFVHGD